MSENQRDPAYSLHVTELEDVLIQAKVGDTEFEKHPGHFQRLLVSVKLFRRCGIFTGRNITDCMDYDRIYNHIISFERLKHTNLLEALAENLIEKCFEDDLVESCIVSLKKPDIYHNACSAGVTFHRLRKDQKNY